MRFVLLDRITKLEPPERAEGLKAVSLSDDVFGEHFPGYPVMPGVLILEGMAQLAGVLIEGAMRLEGHDDLHAILTMVERAKFRKLVRPGDQLKYFAETVRVSEDGGQVKVQAKRANPETQKDDRIAEATLGFVFAQVSDERLLQTRRDVLAVWLHGSIEARENQTTLGQES